MTSYSPPIPVKVRTARKRHVCDDCLEPIEPGEKYELSSLPPGGELGYEHWQTWKCHAPRTGPESEHLLGCDVAAAYRDKAERENG